MSHMQPAFPIERVRLFATDGMIFRAFGHLLAARMGTLLLIPFNLVVGRCYAVVDGCPVPWEEVFAVLEYPSVNPQTDPNKWNAINNHVQQLVYLGLNPADCEIDYISPLANGKEKVLRFVHSCGVMYAVVE
jgi:hypothetical protein